MQNGINGANSGVGVHNFPVVSATMNVQLIVPSGGPAYSYCFRMDPYIDEIRFNVQGNNIYGRWVAPEFTTILWLELIRSIASYIALPLSLAIHLCLW